MTKLSYTLIAAAICCIGLTVSGKEEKMAMNVLQGDVTTSIALDDIRSISFNGAEMSIATNDSKTRQVRLDDVTRITFDLTLIDTGVDRMFNDLKDDVTMHFHGGFLTVGAPDATPLTVDVYALNGIRLKHAEAVSSVTVNLNDLPKGTYVIKANNVTAKYVR